MKTRKILALLITFPLLFAFAFTGLAQGGGKLDVPLLDAMDLSAAEWAESASMRELFAGMVILEIVLSEDNGGELDQIIAGALASDRCCVATGSGGVTVIVFFPGESATLMVSYTPRTGARWSLLGGSGSFASAVIASMKTHGALDDYFPVDSDRVREVLESLQSLTGE